MQTSLNDPENETIRLISTGDTRAFATLFHEHKELVYSTAMAYTKNQTAADDIVQDVFIEIWKRRTQLTTLKDFKAYLYVMTKNRCLNALKKSTRERTIELSADTQDTTGWLPENSNTATPRQLEALLLRALDRLSPQQRRVFELSRNEGKTRVQIAAQLGINEHTVRTHMNLALRTIRAFLTANLENIILFTMLKIFLK